MISGLISKRKLFSAPSNNTRAMKLFLAIDLGTSACRALVADERGRELALASREYPVHEPGPGRQEQDWREVFQGMSAATRKAVSGIDKKRIAAISFSSAMHGFMPVDKDSRPLLRMMTWADGRSQGQAQKLAADFGGEIFQRTGCMATALYYPARILWLKANARDVFKRTRRFVSLKDLIVRELIGKWVVDQSQASSNGLLNIRGLEWDETMLRALGISEEMLPELIAPDAVAGELASRPAKALGLPAGIPVIAGAGDGGLANLGSGAIDPGQIAATIGTTGAMRKIFGRPWLAPSGKIWCYYLASGLWYAGGAINSGGIILRWLRDGLLSSERDAAAKAGMDPYTAIIRMAERAGPGAGGLLFLPHLFGERTPHWNPEARGVLFGISPGHGKAHVARAALEGICMCMAQIFELLKDSPAGVKEIRASGGFARSRLWVQIFADILGQPVAVCRARESSALGAAMLGMKAVGVINSLAQARKMVKLTRVLEPDPGRTRFYQPRFLMFKDLYSRLEPEFLRWARLQG